MANGHSHSRRNPRATRDKGGGVVERRAKSFFLKAFCRSFACFLLCVITQKNISRSCCCSRETLELDRRGRLQVSHAASCPINYHFNIFSHQRSSMINGQQLWSVAIARLLLTPLSIEIIICLGEGLVGEESLCLLIDIPDHIPG